MTFIETGPVLDTAVLYHVLQQTGCLIHEEFGAVSREREWLIMFMEFLPRICGLISVLGNVRRNKKRLDCGSSACSCGFPVVTTGGENQCPSRLQFHFSFQSSPRHLEQGCAVWPSLSMELPLDQSTGIMSVGHPKHLLTLHSHKPFVAASAILSGFGCWLVTLHLVLNTQAMIQLKKNSLKKWTNSRELSSQPNGKLNLAFSSLKINWGRPSRCVFRTSISLEFNQAVILFLLNSTTYKDYVPIIVAIFTARSRAVF